jgi:hypothetical protein
MSLFGRREKRRIRELEAARDLLIEQRDEARDAASGARSNVKRLAKTLNDRDSGAYERRLHAAWRSARQRAAQQQAEAGAGRRALRSSTRSYLHLMDTGEPMAMFTGPSRAQQYADRLGRALRACARYRRDLAAQYRVTDFLGQQLMDSVSGQDPRLKVLADAVKSSEVSS